MKTVDQANPGKPELDVTDLEPLNLVPGVSEEEYYSQGEDSPWQYLGGDLVREPVSFLHDDLNSFLIALLRGYVDERGGAVVTGSRFPMRLDPRWSPEPDLMAIREDRRHLVGPQRLEGPADLVIEILSASHPEITLRRKLPRYREARLPEIWTIDPLARSLQAEVWIPAGAGKAGASSTKDGPGEMGSPASKRAAASPRPATGAQEAGAAGSYQVQNLAAGRLETAAVPGFWIEVSWLWQEPLPSSLACLLQILS